MNHNEVIVCEKHKKKQANLANIPNNYYVCMNRYCPDAYTFLCSTCKPEHRDHAMKVLAIQDAAFLIDRLLKMPFRQAATFIVQSVQVLKRLKLVNEFSRKVSGILKQLQQQTIDLVNMTENIIAQYAQCKKSAQQISEALYQFESKEAFEQFKINGIQKLRKIDFNFQKDRFEYGSLQIKQKQDIRRKNLAYVRRKIEEIKQYSMKIIEVILNNDQSQQQEQDIVKKKKIYQGLKTQILNLNISKIDQKQQNESNGKDKNSLSTKSQQKQIIQVKKIETKQKPSQTQNKWIEELQKKIKQLEVQLTKSNVNVKRLQTETKSLSSQLQTLTLTQKKTQMQLKNKITVVQREKQNLVRQKQNLRKQKQKVQKACEQKVQIFNHYEKRLRDNFNKRTARYKQREQIIKQLSQLIEHQRVDSRGRESGQKQNRAGSKTKKQQ